MKRHILPLVAAVALLSGSGCKTRQLAMQRELEHRQLDTLVVTAPHPERTDEPETFALPRYNPSAPRRWDLHHTRLELTFDWEREAVLGQATLLLSPYFYPTDRLTLDAKGFEFHHIRLAGTEQELPYEYDGQQVHIELGKTWTRHDTLQLWIDYTAHPSASGGSAAITSDKGLYFINPRGETPGKPRQIWTQGETESNSRWFPTIDKPNERCTQEIILTVDTAFETLSNGLLVHSTDNGDGTRTDYWRMDLPHAPYLFMLAIGDFAVVRDQWRGKPVAYYVEHPYAPYARQIYPHTPEMLSFFSDLLGIEYPWQKFSQVVVRDYVSGAMENTTAVIYGDFIQGTDREIAGQDINEKIVAHEMFHHWFGNLVTCESWANLTLQEGFANYGEYLWIEYKHGRDQADAHLYNELQGYLGAVRRGGIHPLIHYGYEDKEDMFDAHSYNKGGLVLHMLRTYVGDEAFFTSLNKYLTDNAFTEVEADELRLAFEDVTGEDLNWFWDQWYFAAGHPELDVQYGYDEATGEATLTITQLQDPEAMPPIFVLPVAIDIYLNDSTVQRHQVRIDQRKQTFRFQVGARPRLINFDADKALLCVKTENKTADEYVFQYYHGKRWRDRFEALSALAGSDTPDAEGVFRAALRDPEPSLRTMAIDLVPKDEQSLEYIARLAADDPSIQVRVAAFGVLGRSGQAAYATVAKEAIQTAHAYRVVGAALQALAELAPQEALAYAKTLEAEDSPFIIGTIGELYALSGDPQYLPFFEKQMDHIDGFGIINFLDQYASLAAQSDVDTAIATAQKLKAIATDASASPWRRFAATRGINTMHAILRERMRSAASDDKAALQATDEALLLMIEQIKQQEASPQLKTLYANFPDPK